jgi:ankyrin repeat protein
MEALWPIVEHLALSLILLLRFWRIRSMILFMFPRIKVLVVVFCWSVTFALSSYGKVSVAEKKRISVERSTVLRSSKHKKHHRTKRQIRNSRLFRSITDIDYVSAEKALTHGASPNARDLYGDTPLLSVKWDIRMAELLLAHGANPNLSRKGWTPIDNCTSDSDLAMATLLLKHGAFLKHRFANGPSPLLWPAFYGQLEIANFLIQHGADINAIDCYGQTPLYFAERQHQEAMIKLLKEHGATKPVKK